MVTRSEVEKIAQLAKLEFTDPEFDALTGELNAVLSHIDQLAELDVSNVQPLAHLNAATEHVALRKDQAQASLPVERALQNAPNAADGYFLVPKVIARTPTTTAVETDEAEEM